MAHDPVPAHIATALKKRMEKLPSVDRNGIVLVEEFGIFMDTHRDQPHVGTFNDDIHRGFVVPTPVDYVITDDLLRHRETGKLLMRHDKHLFITPETWAEFMLGWIMRNGEDPRGGDGSLPTSHFRDARAKRYLLKSFRQMVAYHLEK